MTLWKIIDPGQPWDGEKVEADNWQDARCEAEELIRVGYVIDLQFEVVEERERA
jgi:hypothetical protein